MQSFPKAYSDMFQLGAAAALSITGFLTYQLSPNAISLFVSYFVLWWAGVEIAKEYVTHQTVTLRGQSKTLTLLTTCVFLWFIPVALKIHQGSSALKLGIDPVLQFRHFSAALAIILIGLAWRAAGLKLFKNTFGLFTVFAPISYSFYLLHVPVLTAIASLGLSHSPVLNATCALAFLFPVCYLLEVRLQLVINKTTNRIFCTIMRKAVQI